MCKLYGWRTFVVAPQNNHGCLFYRRSSSNDALLKIANDYAQRQIDCAHAGITYSNEPTYQVTESRRINYVQLKLTLNSKREEITNPMKITAMALPWGGLLDIEHGGCFLDPKTKTQSCQFWNGPHASHNDRKKYIIGFNGLAYIDPQIRLLRDVILDNGGGLPVSTEGGDTNKTANHFHIRFPN